MRLILILAVAVLLALALPGGAGAAGPPGPVALAQGWDYAVDPADQGTIQNWQSGRQGFGWQPTTVPHVLDARTDPQVFYGSIGWYRLTFNGPATRPGRGWAPCLRSRPCGR